MSAAICAKYETNAWSSELHYFYLNVQIAKQVAFNNGRKR